MLSGSITFLRNTRKKRVPIYSVQSLTALQTFANHIDALSNAGVRKVSITQTQDITGVQAATYPQDFDGYYAIFRFKNSAPDEGENPYKEFHLADPLANLFDQAGNGYVIKKTIGDQVATWYSALTGKTYTFVKGWLWGG
jgi:hypothetical protein